jgi:hypothetical protein
MPKFWIRVLVAIVVTIAAVVIGISITGSPDVTADPDTGLVAGANAIALVIAVSLLLGLVAYGAVEYLQTGAVDSIARQFDTRTIVLIPIAIAINIILGQTVAQALKIPIYLDSIGTVLVGVIAGPIPGLLTGLLTNLIWTFVLAGTPFGSPYAWPFAIVAAEIGLLAGVFGYLGFFRSRPYTPTPQLIVGAVATIAILGGLAVWGILPFYTEGVTFFGDLSEVDTFFVVTAYALAALIVIAIVALMIQLFVKRDLGVAYVVVSGAICGVISAVLSAPISAFGFGGVTGAGTDLLVGMFQQAGSSLADAVLQQGLISDPIDKTITFILVFVLLQNLPRRFVARFPQGERAIGTVEG